MIIDEVQRIPELLNEVHDLIESRGLRFILTGSSARALRKLVSQHKFYLFDAGVFRAIRPTGYR